MPPRRAKKPPPATLTDLLSDDGSEPEVPVTAPPKKKAPAAKGRKKAEIATEADDEDTGAEAPAPSKKGGRQTKAKSAPARKGRAIKKQQEESEEEEEEEENDEEEEQQEEEEVVAPPKKRSGAAVKKVTGKKKGLESEAEDRPKPKGKRMSKREKEAAAAMEAAADNVMEIAETQFEPMEMDEDEQDELEIAPTPTQVHTAVPRQRAGAKGKGKKVVAIQEDSEDELNHAPSAIGRSSNAMRAQKKAERLQTLEMFQQKIQQDRNTSAEKILIDFKRSSAEQMKNSEALIRALQSDLDAQTKLAGESKSLLKQLSNKDAEIKKLESKIKDLNKQVSDSHKENQVLQAKVASAQLVQKGVPNSAIKPHARGMPGKAAAAANASHADIDWVTRAKDELFGDLTNLIIVNAKPDGGKRLFECIQTGANGTLNFKLSVRESIAGSKKTNGTTQAGEDDEEGHEYVFIPQLDPSRDEYVTSLLPEYLRGEISFSRLHAARFYQKINSVLMKPPVVDDGDSEEDDGDTTMYTDATGITGYEETIVDEEMA
ncbi:chromosome segregation protein Csm1/Pcs1-domain-containing protein [Geopyxis carbonaria]|nr:chromosome segregation protein Csm1/Pcs1-domain-containing protein [Geopyxis carbonaria]